MGLLVGRLDGRSDRQSVIFSLKGREIKLPYSYQGTCLLVHLFDQNVDLRDCADILESRQLKGDNCLVHCNAGVI